MVMKKKQYIPNVLEKYRNNLKYFKHLKNIVEAYETHKKSKALETEMQSEDKDRIHAGIEALNEWSRPFAEMAMDEAIGKAMQGKKISE
jgi:hypothetical protein